MSKLSHLRLENSTSALPYTRPPSGGSSVFQLPPRDRVPHAQQLSASLKAAESEVDTIRQNEPAADPVIDGVPITLRSDAGFELPIESLERRPQGIELLSVKVDSTGATTANLFVPRGKVAHLLRLIEDYEKEDSVRTRKDGTVSSKPKNERLVRSIATIQRVAIDDLWCDADAVRPQPNQAIWWEVWGRCVDESPSAAYERIRQAVQPIQATISSRFVSFPERIVCLVYATAEQLGTSIDFISTTAELRRAKEIPTAYLELAAKDQADWVKDLRARLMLPASDAPAVCLLDTGVNRNHLLIEPLLDSNDWQAVDPVWQASDHDQDQHGTGMAGTALYRCLTDVFTSTGPVEMRHRLESVKLLPPPPLSNSPDVYGSVTQEAVSKAIIAAPQRNRAICMAVTTKDDRDHGLPSSWSATVDQMCAGAVDEIPKLMFISTGNFHAVMQQPSYVYPESNFTQAGIQDPSQSWNAITVGACTALVNITDPMFVGWNPIATAGDLCPTSRTSTTWSPDDQKGWPIKPDMVMEGGNYIESGTSRDACADLSLLTTIVHPTGRLLTHMSDTSAATAQAARAAAIIWSHYPKLWPETIRALLIHSCRWTPAMMSRISGNSKADVQRRLRCYGYGEPDLERAIYSAENATTLLYEGELQPFELLQVHKNRNGRVVSETKIKTKEMHLHQLPWPTQVLQDLGETPVTMRVTLSYFIEPSPGRKGWGRKFRFASHGLRFDVKSPLESIDAFKKRISKAVWDEDDGRPDNVQETRNWIVGARNRTHGSIHSDWWQGTASELAASGYVAVYPVTGWWRERRHLGKLESKARYSLIISIETPDQAIDLYHPIEAFATVKSEVVIQA